MPNLQQTATLDPTLWKPAPQARKVFTILTDSSAATPQVLFVGGIVRNAVMGRDMSGDADLATVHTPEEVTRRLVAEGIKAVPTGIEHGTVTAVIDGIPFEITTLRRDVETNGRHAVISFTTDWREDAERRDFTMNTLLADFDGRVYDPTGRGVEDARAGRVIFVGDPAQRIAEDYLRILRFFRFHLFYGSGAPDEDALAACRKAAEQITTLSRERITQEIRKILAADDPADILALIRNCGIMTDMFSGFDPQALSSLCRMQKEAGLQSIEARLHIFGAERLVLEKYFVFSREQSRFIEKLDDLVGMECDLKERIYRYGRDAAAQAVLIDAAQGGQAIGNDVLSILKGWPVPVFPINGKDLAQMGLSQGPDMGRILRDVEAWWIAEEFTPGRDECLERARAVI